MWNSSIKRSVSISNLREKPSIIYHWIWCGHGAFVSSFQHVRKFPANFSLLNFKLCQMLYHFISFLWFITLILSYCATFAFLGKIKLVHEVYYIYFFYFFIYIIYDIYVQCANGFSLLVFCWYLHIYS
jgi:hypothetical protein